MNKFPTKIFLKIYTHQTINNIDPHLFTTSQQHLSIHHN